MDPGRFNKRIRLVRLDETGRDAAGAPVLGRVEIARPWAELIYPGGREFLASDGEVTERKVVARIYTRDDVDTDTTVVIGGVDHEIQDVRPVNDLMELHLMVRA